MARGACERGHRAQLAAVESVCSMRRLQAARCFACIERNDPNSKTRHSASSALGTQTVQRCRSLDFHRETVGHRIKVWFDDAVVAIEYIPRSNPEGITERASFWQFLNHNP